MYGNVLIIGAGVAGLRAAFDLADAGVDVVLVEKEPVVGGIMAASLGDAQEASNLVNGMQLPDVAQIHQRHAIELLTLAEVVAVSGQAGKFVAEIRQRARYVTDACTRCHRCHSVCPAVAPNHFLSDLTYRKAIYTPFQGAVPEIYAIDIDTCLNDPPNYLACQRCVEVCDDRAIYFEDARDTLHTRDVSAIIVTAGFQLSASGSREHNGSGVHPDVLTWIELEHLLTPAGPMGGYVEKVSNGDCPQNVLYAVDNASRFTCLCVATQVDRLAAQDITDVTILHPDRTDTDEDFSEFMVRHTRSTPRLTTGTVENVASHDEDTIHVRYKPLGARVSVTQDFDMVVFTTAVAPPPDLADLAGVLGIELDEDGFVKPGEKESGLTATTCPGIYVAGCAGGVKDIRDSIAESKAAVVNAMRHLDRRRDTHETVAASNGHSGLMIDGKWLSEEEIHRHVERILLSLMTSETASSSPPHSGER